MTSISCSKQERDLSFATFSQAHSAAYFLQRSILLHAVMALSFWSLKSFSQSQFSWSLIRFSSCSDDEASIAIQNIRKTLKMTLQILILTPSLKTSSKNSTTSSTKTFEHHRFRLWLTTTRANLSFRTAQNRFQKKSDIQYR